MYIRHITKDYLWGKVIHIFSISNIDYLYFHPVCPKGFFAVCMYVRQILDLVRDSSSYFKEKRVSGTGFKETDRFHLEILLSLAQRLWCLDSS